MASPGNTGFHLTLFGIALVIVGVLLLSAFALGTVDADEVGVLVNNMTGEMTTRTQPGTYIYNAIITDFYTIEKTEQTIEMTARTDRGDRAGEDHIRIKTCDGSDVDVDVTVNYQLQPQRAAEILRSSGLDDQYKEKWVRDFSRSICRNRLGELTTEQFYQAADRTQKANTAKDELNGLLEPYGLRVTTVQVQSFRFYKEYEEKIKQKKLADQEVEEQKSQAKAAIEARRRRETETKKEVDVEIAKFRGELEQTVLSAKAKDAKERREADAYAYAVKKKAGADLVKNLARAKAVLATAEAEAAGTEAMASALAGQGGRNLVLLEYARKLKQVRISGTPIRHADFVEKLDVQGRGSAVRALTGKGGER